MGFPLTATHYDKKLSDFGKRVKKKYVKTTIIVDYKSQIIIIFSVGDILDSKESKKIAKSTGSEVIGKFDIIIGDKGYDSEGNHIIAKNMTF